MSTVRTMEANASPLRARPNASSTNWAQQKCPDCPFLPALCQTVERECHSDWHEPSFDELRNVWVARGMDKHQSSPSAPEARVLRSRRQPQEPLHSRNHCRNHCTDTCTRQEASEASALTLQDSLVSSAGTSNLHARRPGAAALVGYYSQEATWLTSGCCKQTSPAW